VSEEKKTAIAVTFCYLSGAILLVRGHAFTSLVCSLIGALALANYWRNRK
jgi:hypothetical protein